MRWLGLNPGPILSQLCDLEHDINPSGPHLAPLEMRSPEY